ncbi:MAG: hypothetical protein ACRD1E_01085 [Terriglobales bacterium]
MKILALSLLLLGSVPPSNTPVPAYLYGCTPEIAAARGGDVDLYRLKDRIQQAASPQPASVDGIAAYAAPSVLTGLPRARWKQPDLDLAAAHEHQGVMVEGFLLAAVPRGWSLWNCNNSRWIDVRLWIGASADAGQRQAIVAVVTPPWQDANAYWDRATLRALAARQPRVRVTGWMLYADDDAVELTRGRRTLWEIHPVTRIEIARPDGSWQELVDLPPPG